MTFVHLCRTLCQFFHSQNENLWKQHTEQQQSAWVNGAIAFSLFLEFVIFSFGRIFRVLFCLRCNLVSFSRGISLGIFGVEPATNVCTHRFYQITNGSWRGGESEKMSRKNNRTKEKKKNRRTDGPMMTCIFRQFVSHLEWDNWKFTIDEKNVWCRSLEKRRHRAQFSASQKNKNKKKFKVSIHFEHIEYWAHATYHRNVSMPYFICVSSEINWENFTKCTTAKKREKKTALCDKCESIILKHQIILSTYPICGSITRTNCNNWT